MHQNSFSPVSNLVQVPLGLCNIINQVLYLYAPSVVDMNAWGGRKECLTFTDAASDFHTALPMGSAAWSRQGYDW